MAGEEIFYATARVETAYTFFAPMAPARRTQFMGFAFVALVLHTAAGKMQSLTCDTRVSQVGGYTST
jgi:hypothetical protein